MNGEFPVSTDKQEIIKLDSAIVLAQWLSSIAVGGSEAFLEVRTVFVAEGSDIEITGKSSQGNAPGTIKGKVYGNKFTGKLPIPGKVTIGAMIWFEARLPKHGLQKESDTAIPAFPQVIMTQMGWDRREVRRNDIVKLNAAFEQVRNNEDVTVFIYEYDSDGHHDKVAFFSTQLEGKRLACSWRFDYARNTGEIPTDAERRKYGKKYEPPQFFFVVEINNVRFGEKQESGLLKFIDSLELVLLNLDDSPVAVAACNISCADGSRLNASTDTNGTILLKNICPGKATIEFRDYAFIEKVNPDDNPGSKAVFTGQKSVFKISASIYSV